ncbi:MAG: hypothetical protein JWQ11_3209, partial [Rhizobacter sp.]|nr:hypothetical protein [Rhizobacter sp.]
MPTSDESSSSESFGAEPISRFGGAAKSVLAIQQLADAKLSEAEAALEAQGTRLALSLSLLTATLESTPDGISVDDLAGRLILYNSRFALMWRLPPEMLARGSTLEVSECITAQLTAESVTAAIARQSTGLPEHESRDIVQLIDGRFFERHVSAQRAGGQVVGIVTSWRDVTDRESSAGLMRAKDVAERANQAKSEFIGRMSHELRTPLNAVLGFSEVLRLDTREPLTRNQKYRLAQIHTAGS